MTRLREIVTGLISLAALLASLVGVPFGLWWVLGALGSAGPRVHSVNDLFAQHSDGSALVLALIGVAALGWLGFVLSVLVELLARIRRVRAPRLPALGSAQRAASALVAGVFLLLPAVSAVSAQAATASPSTAPVAVTALQHSGTGASAQQVSASPSTRLYTVQHPDETLWDIAANQLGSGQRWHEIVTLNTGRYIDGKLFDPNAPLEPGWQLYLPTSTPVSAASTATAQSTDVTVEHTVVADESLWKIAQETWGQHEGGRYTEIYDANEGKDLDGHKLDDPDLIYPGQVLTIPDAPGTVSATTSAPSTTNQSPATSTTTTHTSASPSAPSSPTAGANTSTSSTTGGSGAVGNGAAGSALSSPAATSKPTVAASPSASSTAAASTAASPAARPSQAASAPATTGTHQDGAPQHVRATVTNDAEEIAIVLGAGVVAVALGTLGLLAGARSLQQRRRRVGERIAMPEGETAETEQELVIAACGDLRVRLGHALRALADSARRAGRSVPEIRAVVANAEAVSLVLAVPDADALAPFQAVEGDEEVWSWMCVADTEIAELAPDAPRVAPYPALVNFGRLADGSLLLVDVEHVGLVQFVGDPQRVSGVLRAMTLELATSTFTQDSTVAVAGFAQDLAEALRTHRLAHTDAGRAVRSIAAWAGQVAGQIEDAGTASLRRARTTGERPDLHTVRIAVLRQVEEEQWATLAELAQAPRRANALALVGATPASAASWGWTLRIDEFGQAQIPGMQLQTKLPQLDDAQWGRLVELFRITNLEAAAADPTWLAALESFTPEQEVGLAELLAGPAAQQPESDARSETEEQASAELPLFGTPEVPEAGDDDASDDAAAAITFTVVPSPAPAAPVALPAAESPQEPGVDDQRDDDAVEAKPVQLVLAQVDRPGSILDLLDGPVEADFSDAIALATAEIGAYRPDPPEGREQWSHLIRLLGPVEIQVEPGAPEWIGTEAMGELAAYMALHPFVTAETIASDVLVGPGKRSTPRGQDVQISKLRGLLGEAEDGSPRLPAADEAGTYALEDRYVASDWSLFHEYVHSGQLAHALALVRGRPLHSRHPFLYSAWAGPMREEMTSAIVDVAHTLVDAYLDAGVAYESARQAAQIGLLGVPDSELLHQDLIRALIACERRGEVDEVVTSVLELCERRGVDPAPGTLKLIYELRGDDGSGTKLRPAS